MRYKVKKPIMDITTSQIRFIVSCVRKKSACIRHALVSPYKTLTN